MPTVAAAVRRVLLLGVLSGCGLAATSARGAEAGNRPGSGTAAEQLLRVAAELTEGGKCEAALPLAKRAWRLQLKRPGRQPSDVARALTALGDAHYKCEHWEPAERAFRQALAIWQRASPQRPSQVAEVQSALANVLSDRGQIKQGEQLYTQALGLRERAFGPTSLEVARSLRDLSVLFVATGRSDQAEAYCQRALLIAQSKLSPNDPLIAELLINLAMSYLHQGHPLKSEPLLLQALDIQTKQLGKRHIDFATTLNNIAGVYREMGLYEKAESALDQAISIQKERLGPRHSDVALSLHNLASVYLDLRLHERAKYAYQSALDIWRATLGEAHPNVAYLHISIAILHQRLGEYDKAEPWVQKAMALYEKSTERSALDYARALLCLATQHQGMGRLALAETLATQALTLTTQSLGVEHPFTVQAKFRLALIHMDQGDDKRAEAAARQALGTWQRVMGERHPFVAEILDVLALLALRQGRHHDAATALAESAALFEQMLKTLPTESRIAALLERMGKSEDILYSLLLAHPDEPLIQRLALAVALLHKGRSAMACLQSQEAQKRLIKEPQEQALFAQLRQLRSELASLYLSDMPRQPTRIRALEAEADGVERQLAQRSIPFRQEQTPDLNHILDAVAAKLAPDSMLLEFLEFHAVNPAAKPDAQSRQPLRYAVLTLHRDASGAPSIQVVNLGAAVAIDSAVQTLFVELSENRPNFLSAAQKLYELVLTPVLAAASRPHQLILSLDGQLHLIPFAALHDGRKFLFEGFRLRNLTSGRDLLRASYQGARTEPMTVLADPLLAAPGEPPDGAPLPAFLVGLGSLPGARLEAELLGSLFPSARILVGAAASKQALMNVQAPTVLHLAVHGAFLDSPVTVSAAHGRGLLTVSGPPPLAAPSALPRQAVPGDPLAQSLLVLAGAGTRHHRPGSLPGLEGLATALEIAALDLHGTELAVLSACESGLGSVLAGQGVYGLQRAFLIAGAQTVLTSLWRIDDQVTREFMESYYRQLHRGGDRVDALAKAAAAVRARHPHPYYWAPFVAVGRDGPVAGLGPAALPKERRWPLIGVAVGLLGVLLVAARRLLVVRWPSGLPRPADSAHPPACAIAEKSRKFSS